MSMNRRELMATLMGGCAVTVLGCMSASARESKSDKNVCYAEWEEVRGDYVPYKTDLYGEGGVYFGTIVWSTPGRIEYTAQSERI